MAQASRPARAPSPDTLTTDIRLLAADLATAAQRLSNLADRLEREAHQPPSSLGADAGPVSPSDAARLMTVTEVAKKLQVGRGTVYRLLAEGQIDSVSIGRLRRVTPEQLEAYVGRLR